MARYGVLPYLSTPEHEVQAQHKFNQVSRSKSTPSITIDFTQLANYVRARDTGSLVVTERVSPRVYKTETPFVEEVNTRRSVPEETVLVSCWRERTIREVPIAIFRLGRTLPCKSKKCKHPDTQAV